MDTLKLTTRSPEETQRLGFQLARGLWGGEVLLMSGRLGAGKTCMTQGIAWGLGMEEYARSPTFVLVSEYRGRLALYHIDLYRLDDIQEMADLGLEEYFTGGGVCVVEWAEKAVPILPPDGLWIRFEIVDDEVREITLQATGPRHRAVLDQLSTALSGTGAAPTGV